MAAADPLKALLTTWRKRKDEIREAKMNAFINKNYTAERLLDIEESAVMRCLMDLTSALGERQETAEPPQTHVALQKLLNECRAVIGNAEPSLRDWIGNTNVNALKLRMDEAAEALAAHREGPATADPPQTYMDLYARLRELVNAKRYKEAFDFVREPLSAHREGRPPAAEDVQG